MLATASIPKPLGTNIASSDLSTRTGHKVVENPQDMLPDHHSGGTFTVHASAMATPVTDTETELTNLGWLQKPGVLSSMFTALTGTPQQFTKPGVRSTRRPRQAKQGESKVDPGRSKTPWSSDKMVNVILNVRNRKYNGEDARKPPLSFACMIFMAVESSPTKTLPVKDIYDWVMWKFPYYRNAPPGWKNSVRHNLSLNKCFKKVERFSGKSGNAVSKGGLWTVDPDYRRSLLAALKRSPYHPYHSYFTPLSPSSSSLDSVDPAERDAALTMCMISGSSDHSSAVTPDLLHAVFHDHCYSKRPVLPPVSPSSLPSSRVTVKLKTPCNKKNAGLTLDEIAAAAELFLAQGSAEEKENDEEAGRSESSDEGFGEVESDLEDGMEPVEELNNLKTFADSGYGGDCAITNAMETSSTLDEMGADALLCLAATGSREESLAQ